ncbi:MAG: hypothetical protein DMG55_14095 [Acidobacteria bacterium]|nr:MAG: hypothetical protein DMG55_14095 [Acidobacteriota bacterium]
MAKFRLHFTRAFLPAVFLAASLQASPPSPGSSPLAEQPSATAATHWSAPAGAPSPPQGRITAYTLPPDLYRKARNRGRIGFASRMIGFFYGLVVLWVVLGRKLSATYRDWAESFSRKRFLQAFIFTPLVVLTIGVLHLPVDTFEESVSKLYKISVEPWSSWAADWAKAQLLAVIIGSLLVWILYAVIRKSPRRWWLYRHVYISLRDRSPLQQVRTALHQGPAARPRTPARGPPRRPGNSPRAYVLDGGQRQNHRDQCFRQRLRRLQAHHHLGHHPGTGNHR